MNFLRKIKNNRWIRGFYTLYHNYFGYKRSAYGYIADNVIITPHPIIFLILKMYI